MCWLDEPVTDARLADARLYLCTDSRRGRGDLPDFLDAVLSGGVDIIQLREKHLEAAEELDLLAVFGRPAVVTGSCWPSMTAPTSPSPQGRTCYTWVSRTFPPPRRAASSARR